MATCTLLWPWRWPWGAGDQSHSVLTDVATRGKDACLLQGKSAKGRIQKHRSPGAGRNPGESHLPSRSLLYGPRTVGPESRGQRPEDRH